MQCQYNSVEHCRPAPARHITYLEHAKTIHRLPHYCCRISSYHQDPKHQMSPCNFCLAFAFWYFSICCILLVCVYPTYSKPYRTHNSSQGHHKTLQWISKLLHLVVSGLWAQIPWDTSNHYVLLHLLLLSFCKSHGQGRLHPGWASWTYSALTNPPGQLKAFYKLKNKTKSVPNPHCK